jgi:aerobic-type carbon monoxide dehydrogenase small subunit (CoxS/CutS family)
MSAVRSPSDTIEVDLVVNGRAERRRVPVRTSLADFLRDELSLTGTKLGCEHGVCGACTVLLDGRAVRSCLTLAAQASGTDVTTVEGLGDGRRLNELQRSLHEHHGLQCGFCTAGFLITATELLASGEPLSEANVREVLSGNICRCTGYEPIVDAVLAVARKRLED